MSLNIKFSYLAENSKFSRSNSYFSILTPTFLRDGFLNSCFQNPSENSGKQDLTFHEMETICRKCQIEEWEKYFKIPVENFTQSAVLRFAQTIRAWVCVWQNQQ